MNINFNWVLLFEAFDFKGLNLNLNLKNVDKTQTSSAGLTSLSPKPSRKLRKKLRTRRTSQTSTKSTTKILAPTNSTN